MESWQIVTGLFTPVLGYLVLSNIQQGKQLAVMQKTVDSLNTRMDMFLKTEVDTLKELVRISNNRT